MDEMKNGSHHNGLNNKREDLWKNYRKGIDVDSLRISFLNHLHYTRLKDQYTSTAFDKYLSLAYTVRDRIVEQWSKTQQTYYNVDAKRIYYLSLEFLLGRVILNNIINSNLYDEMKYMARNVGIDMEELIELEPDAGLGNGGLGRLAACFIDSMATLQLPGYGYGLRYEFGIFNQIIQNGNQIEEPDEWLKFGYPWEIERPEYAIQVDFYGDIAQVKDEYGRPKNKWQNTQKIMAVPHDIPIVGYGNNNVNTLRLWSAKSSKEFDLKIFNHGDYIKAVELKNSSENISRVLYPNDNIYEGKELRLKQEYFFVSASLQDIIRRYLKSYDTFEKFPDKVALQLNDTHPTLSIPELMRQLVDVYDVPWEKAWDITVKTVGFTNHTVLPEAMEKWPMSLMSKLLPRHTQIVNDINSQFLNKVRVSFPGDMDKLRRMSIIEEGNEKQVRMANLAIVGSHSVNGVSKLHSEILKNSVFKDFFEMIPDNFNNKTNGITPRRWLLLANPELSRAITEKIGDKWIVDLSELKQLEQHINDEQFLVNLHKIKIGNKKKLAVWVKNKLNIDIDINSLFDVQVKRIHEYKRQLLNVLHILMLYNKIKENPNIDILPRTFIFGGKAAPGYHRAKLIIKLINNVGNLINNDKSINNKIKVIFLPNYGVSLAEILIPAADISEQISTAGKEASGTGNMKFALNGAITVGTLDGANIEIMECVGKENIYIFGMTAEEIEQLKHSGKYNPWEYYNKYPEIKKVMDMLKSEVLSEGESGLFLELFDSIMNGIEGSAPDQYFVLADLMSYVGTQNKLNTDARDKIGWMKKMLLNVANMGYFSSDRAIVEYNDEIWHVNPVDISLE